MKNRHFSKMKDVIEDSKVCKKSLHKKFHMKDVIVASSKTCSAKQQNIKTANSKTAKHSHGTYSQSSNTSGKASQAINETSYSGSHGTCSTTIKSLDVSRSMSFKHSKIHTMTAASTSDPFSDEDYVVEEDYDNGQHNDIADEEQTGLGEDDGLLETNGRGPSLPWDAWGKKKIMLQWTEKGIPVSTHAAQFNNHICRYARNFTWFPLDYVRFDAIENVKATLKLIWREVQVNTNAPDAYEKLMEARISKAWRSLKYSLKLKYYDVYETDEERLKNKPPQVEMGQWKNLVNYWGLLAFKQLSQQNKQNRENLVAYSRTGRTTHDEIREKRRQQGLPIDKITTYLLTRGKNGVYEIADGTAGKVAALNMRLEELPEEDREDPDLRNNIFEEVIGKDGHGRVHLEGVGIRPISKRAKHASCLHSSAQQQKIEELETIIKQNEQQQQQKDAKNKAEMDDIKSKLDFVLGVLHKVDPSLLVPTNAPSDPNHERSELNC